MDATIDRIGARHKDLLSELGEHVEALAEERPDTNLDVLHRFLAGELLPHAHSEELYLFVAVEPLLREHGRATDTMAIDLEVIKRYIDRMEELIFALETGPSEDEAAALRARLRKAAVRLEAIIELHLEKQERVYLPMLARYLSPGEQQQLFANMESRERLEWLGVG